METRSLRPDDVRKGFHSGDSNIDDFLHRYAGQNQWRHHVGVTFGVWAEQALAAFLTISGGAVDPNELSGVPSARLPRYPAPVLRLSRLGVDQHFQGRGLGRELLYVAADIAFEMRVRVGCVGIVVDAKSDAVRFYERHGFRVLPITSRMAGAGAPPVRLFTDLRHLLHGAATARDGLTAADSLASEMRRRARELGLSADEVRTAVDRMLG